MAVSVIDVALILSSGLRLALPEYWFCWSLESI